MGGRSPDAADLKSIARSLQPLRLAVGIEFKGRRSLGVSTRGTHRPKREVQRHACHVNALSILPFDVLLHLSPHLEQPALSPREERHHLVDVGIAWQLELWLTRLCGGRTWYTGYWQPTGEQFLF